MLEGFVKTEEPIKFKSVERCGDRQVQCQHCRGRGPKDHEFKAILGYRANIWWARLAYKGRLVHLTQVNKQASKRQNPKVRKIANASPQLDSVLNNDTR